MIKVLWYCLKLAAVVVVAIWLAERPGDVSMQWLGYRIETSVGLLLLAGFIVAVASAALYRFWRFLYRAPRGVGRALQADRRKRGYKALTQGMVAVAAGAPEEARRWARKADGLLDEPPLTMLLSAQAAQLDGDEAAARRYFEAMLENVDTRFLGLRGLLTQALQAGDETAALDFARRAYDLRPQTPWVLTTLFDLSERSGDFETAQKTLKQAQRQKALPALETARKRAVVFVEQARGAGDSGVALGYAREAHKLAPDLVPAAVLLAELLDHAGQSRKAAKVLEKTWRLAPQRELAQAYLALSPGDDGVTRMQRLNKLTGSKPTDAESHLVLARAALAAQLWGEARRHLSAMAAKAAKANESPNDLVCRLMAELEETENEDTAEARHWLLKATDAPADSAWVCGSCGAIAVAWVARCSACHHFDSLAWTTPPRIAAPVLEQRSAEPPTAETKFGSGALISVAPKRPATPPPVIRTE